MRAGLAVRYPHRGRVVDLVAELRRCLTPIQAEAVLATQTTLPWTGLVEAHQTEPLPKAVLCALAGYADFPAALVGALSEEPLSTFTPRNRATALAAVAALAHRPGIGELISRIRPMRSLTDAELTAAVRPARDLINYLRILTSPERYPADPWLDHYIALVCETARSAPPGFWTALLDLMPTHDGTVPELLARARHP
ncbi:hypothetical protein FNH05_25735 [Amycolatopsis rhizosphaerae]|uniref:Uncharacterized protein n=1 Tax=Amycolatopsis rhizosphaerae TaxID=2053003 RepID=A0A558BIJ6_9PSEU|nr:hypothetical protein [Amycolatopsis rhizosphaerae]TVT36343.1 hypothetical protein FNH05_25735 [Amycolatopsis rhizosphaerae]